MTSTHSQDLCLVGEIRKAKHEVYSFYEAVVRVGLRGEHWMHNHNPVINHGLRREVPHVMHGFFCVDVRSHEIIGPLSCQLLFLLLLELRPGVRVVTYCFRKLNLLLSELNSKTIYLLIISFEIAQQHNLLKRSEEI